MFGYSESRVVSGGRESANLIAQLRAGEDGDDTGMLARRIRVDAIDFGMRVRAPENRDVKHMRELDIVHVLAAPGNQIGIFAPLDPGTDKLAYGHDFSWFKVQSSMFKVRSKLNVEA